MPSASLLKNEWHPMQQLNMCRRTYEQMLYLCLKSISKIERNILIDIEAPIKEVTVYSDRALVIRSDKVELEVREHELRVNNLPQFLRDSLRAAGRGPAGIRILNVDVTTAFRSC